MNKADNNVAVPTQVQTSHINGGRRELLMTTGESLLPISVITTKYSEIQRLSPPVKVTVTAVRESWLTDTA